VNTPLNFDNAQKLVEVYLAELQHKDTMQLGRTWLEVQMGKVGFAPEYHSQKWQFGESHAAWYAALIYTRNITRVTKAESIRRPSKTAKTIKRLNGGNLHNTATGNHLERMLAALQKLKEEQK